MPGKLTGERHDNRNNISLEESGFSFPDKSSLSRLRLRALRSGVWFKALRRIDRVLVDVTLMVTGRVRNPKLAKTLATVMAKLENALRGPVKRAMDEVGFSLARRLSMIGVRLGNFLAREWANDFLFVRFLAVMHMNSSCSSRH